MKRFLILHFYLLISVLSIAQCIDFTDLRSSSVKCTYGTFANPYGYVGIIDDGPSAGSSRHTIHTDPNERDPRTDNNLRTVPVGEYASVRLGNWSVGAQAESITYEYNVDNETNPILVFKYAAVMEDPGHTPSEQPRLTLEILDENNHLVDSYCGAFDFIASQSLGWNVSSDGILWKDWTAVGLDLSAYSGQTIHIRFTTYDCERKGHYGYAYLNISCQQKKIKSLTCGRNAMSKFSGPDGFEYKWYTLDGSTKQIIGNSQSITVPTDETMYYCEVNQTGKPTCSFTLNVKADPRLPLANFNYVKKGTCVDTLYLTNLSSVSRDGQLPNSPMEDCDEYIWDLGDGRIVNTKDITTPIFYENTGNYRIRLTAKLTNGNCEHTYEKNIFMRGYADEHTKHLYDTICSNGFFMFNSQRIESAGTYTHTIETSYGCDSTTILHMVVNPSYFFEQEAYTCDYQPYSFRGKQLFAAGIYYDSLLTRNGCDSIYKLTLKVNPTSLIEKTVTICDNEEYNFRGRVLSESGIYYDSLFSINGCDSVYKLNLKVLPKYEINKTIHICKGESYFFKGQQLSEGGIYYDSLKSVMGCDSIIKLILIVNPTYLFEKNVSICDNETYDFRGIILNHTGTYYDYLKTQEGCDSIYKLNLTVNQTYFFEEKVTICDNHPYPYRGKIYNQTGLYYDSLKTTTGCDSIYKLDITVNKTYQFNESATICDFDYYKFQGKMLNKTGIYKDTIPTICGCDSVYILTLRTRPTIIDTIDASICLGDYYVFAGNTLYNDGIYTDTIYQPLGDGCEIHTLRLSTVATTIISSANVDNACADDSVYQIKYNYTGPTPLTYSLYYDNYARQMGFKDVHDAPFQAIITDKIPQFADKIYLRPDIYKVRIEFNNGACLPSLSAYEMSFMIKYPSWLLEQNWNDVVAVLNTDYNGGYDFSQFDWYVNNHNIITDGESYIYKPQYLHTGDNVYASMIRSGENYSICTCPIVITDISNELLYEEPLLISVNPTSRIVKFYAPQKLKLSLFDIYGHHYYSIYTDEGEGTLKLPYNLSGVFILSFQDDNRIITKKIIL